MKIKILLTLCLIAYSNISLGEGNCPSGQYPIGDGRTVAACAPIPGYDNGQQQPQAPQGRWETRWGAIAIGDTRIHGVGLIKNAKSKRSAQNAAMSQCLSNGGGSACEIVLTYYNQCAVIAWGDTTAFTQGAETIEIASTLAMKRCIANNTNCKILYADCSNAEWVSY